MKRLLLSPMSLAVAAAGAVVGFVAGDSAGAVAGLLVGWGAGTGIRAALPGGGRGRGAKRRREPIDPFRLKEPWRQFVQGSVKAQRRYREAVDHAKPGPLRDRLLDVGLRVDEAVDECWSVAKQGNALTIARSRMKAAEAERELARLLGQQADPAAGGPAADDLGDDTGDDAAARSTGSRPSTGRPKTSRSGPAPGDPDDRALADAVAELGHDAENLPFDASTGMAFSFTAHAGEEQRIESLQAQVDAARRVDATIKATADRLRILEARLDETVARAHELSVHADDVSELAGLVDDVDGVVGDLEALRLALEETTRKHRSLGP